MLWVAAIFGVVFGWIGILAAALFYLTISLATLTFQLFVLGAKLLLAVSALLARAIIWLYHRLSARRSQRTSATRSMRNTTSTNTKAIPAGLKPKRKRRKLAANNKKTTEKS